MPPTRCSISTVRSTPTVHARCSPQSCGCTGVVSSVVRRSTFRGWCCILAARGFAVVAPRYSLAPEVEYPTPVQQVVDVISHLGRDAARLGIDPARVVLAGDSAGAQIAAQVAAVLTDPEYAAACEVEVAEGTTAPVATVLCCGPYDLGLVRPGKGIMADFETCCMWSYSGSRTFRTNRAFSTMSVVDHLTPAFPPTFVTVGNADPLAPHTASLVEALEAQDVPVEQAGFDAAHEPARWSTSTSSTCRSPTRATRWSRSWRSRARWTSQAG